MALNPPELRDFFDPEKTRKFVFDNVKSAFDTKLNSLETDKYKLKVTNLAYEPKTFTLKDQNNAIMERSDVTVPLTGTVQLLDKTSGKVVDEKKKTVIAQVPYVTERNSSILHGSEYITVNQQRLKPGIYTRIKESGEAEAHVNVMPGTGLGGRIIFYPDKALFVYQVGTTQIKLFGLLRDLGISEVLMKQQWGEEIFQKNKQAYDGSEFDKFYNKIFSRQINQAKNI